MNESYLEIVELENGEIVLRPVALEDDKEAEPLVVLKLSNTTKSYLKDNYFELAKHMFGAGIDYIYSDESMTNYSIDESDAFELDEELDDPNRIIH